jgi:hypothetical protein
MEGFPDTIGPPQLLHNFAQNIVDGGLLIRCVSCTQHTLVNMRPWAAEGYDNLSIAGIVCFG